MNQDNQVGWENEMVQFAEKYLPKGIAAPSFFLSDLSKLIRLVKRDSYAEGIRRAGEAIYKRQKDECEKNGSCFTSIQQTICDPCIYFSSALAALGSIEEEVKK